MAHLNYVFSESEFNELLSIRDHLLDLSQSDWITASSVKYLANELHRIILDVINLHPKKGK
jgi:hypothetical protein